MRNCLFGIGNILSCMLSISGTKIFICFSIACAAGFEISIGVFILHLKPSLLDLT